MIDLRSMISPIAKVDAFRQKLRAEIARKWQQQARAHMGPGSSTETYASGIRETDTGVELVGTLPNILEQGMGAGGVGTEGSYSSDRYLRGTKAKTAKDGHKYAHIPIGKGLDGGKGGIITVSAIGRQWRHPGVKARRLAALVLRDIPSIIRGLL